MSAGSPQEVVASFGHLRKWRSGPSRRQQLVPVLGDRGRTGEIRLDHVHEPRLLRCDAVPVEEPFEIGEQEAMVARELRDAAVDCVGFEAKGHGAGASEAPATVLNSVMAITRAAGRIGIPGLYVTGDPGGIDENAKRGQLGINIGLGWAKSLSFATGQTPVMRYHRELMVAILNGKVQIAKAVNATVIPLEDAPKGYADFDKGAAKKFVLNPHGLIPV